jgi:putative ABC transport system permease protein
MNWRDSQLGRDLWRDLQYAARLLRRHAGFTTTALLTMALGIGMTAAIFSVLQAVLLRPAPFPDADRIQMVWETDRSTGTTREPGAIPDFLDFIERSRQIDRFGGFGSYEATLQPPSGDPIRAASLAVTAGFLELLDVTPMVGRVFSPEEYRARGPFVVLISERLWTTRFERRPSVIGSVVRLNDRPATVVGVVADDADFGVLQMLASAAYARGFADRDARTRVDVWSPIQPDPATMSRDGHGLLMIGRLAPGATVASAQDELARIAADLERTYPSSNRSRGVFVEPIREVIFGRVETPLMVLTAASLLVLLLACVNVANLLLARGAARMREVAVRIALGAAVPRLLRQFAVENALLTFLAAALGIALAYGTLAVLIAWAPPTIPRLTDVRLDPRALSLTLGVSVCVAIIFGFFPMVRVGDGGTPTVLKNEETRGVTGRSGGVRSALVVVEISMAVLLLAAAGLLVRSFWLIQQTDPGFDATGVLKAEFQLPASRYPVDFRRAAPGYVAFNRFKDDLLARVARVPGVQAAAVAGSHPLAAGGTTSFRIAGREAEGQNWPELTIRGVTPGYFTVVRTPVMRGRLLRDSDTTASSRAVVVNRAFAERFFPDQDPLGQRLTFFGPTEWTIVGVIENERFHGLISSPSIAAYVPLAQAPSSTPALLVRTPGDPLSIAMGVRAAIREIDPALAVFAMEPLADTLSNSLTAQRFLMLLLVLFAALAVTLAAIGVYGVLAYLVAQRTKEIGVRMSLGASARDVAGLVARQGTTLAGLGLVIGIALALASSRWLSGLLFQIAPTDVATFAAVAGIMAIVVAVSIWVPVQRAVSIDPLVALRKE